MLLNTLLLLRDGDEEELFFAGGLDEELGSAMIDVIVNDLRYKLKGSVSSTARIISEF